MIVRKGLIIKKNKRVHVWIQKEKEKPTGKYHFYSNEIWMIEITFQPYST